MKEFLKYFANYGRLIEHVCNIILDYSDFKEDIKSKAPELLLSIIEEKE